MRSAHEIQNIQPCASTVHVRTSEFLTNGPGLEVFIDSPPSQPIKTIGCIPLFERGRPGEPVKPTASWPHGKGKPPKTTYTTPVPNREPGEPESQSSRRTQVPDPLPALAGSSATPVKASPAATNHRTSDAAATSYGTPDVAKRLECACLLALSKGDTPPGDLAPRSCLPQTTGWVAHPTTLPIRGPGSTPARW